MEPGAASYRERLNALKALHDAGCKTWVSIEPYPTPNLIEQDLSELLDAVSFTDKIIFGRTNYSKEISSYKIIKHFTAGVQSKSFRIARSIILRIISKTAL